jgi:hypothetical protein
MSGKLPGFRKATARRGDVVERGPWPARCQAGDIPILCGASGRRGQARKLLRAGNRRFVHPLDSGSSGPCGSSPRKWPFADSGNRDGEGGSCGLRRNRRRKLVIAAAWQVGQSARSPAEIPGSRMCSQVVFVLQISTEGVRSREAQPIRVGCVTGDLARCGNPVAGEKAS